MATRGLFLALKLFWGRGDLKKSASDTNSDKFRKNKLVNVIKSRSNSVFDHRPHQKKFS